MMIRRRVPYLMMGLCLLPTFFNARNALAQTSLILIKEIRFEGNESIPAARLKLLLQRLREGNPYKPGNLAADLQRVEMAYQDEGFLGARVGPADVQIKSTTEGKVATLTIPVVEGARYRVGSVAVKKVQVFSPATLMQMCPLKKGAPYSRTKISQWQAMIEDAYREMGYARIRCRADDSLSEADKTVDCVLECEEGRPYSIGTITLMGDESIDPSKFKRQLLFGEGGVFNPDMISTSILYLNRTGLYRTISNSDVKFDVDDEKGTVNVTLRVFLARR
jgi:outer membrane protein insertion porin family